MNNSVTVFPHPVCAVTHQIGQALHQRDAIDQRLRGPRYVLRPAGYREVMCQERLELRKEKDDVSVFQSFHRAAEIAQVQAVELGLEGDSGPRASNVARSGERGLELLANERE